MMSGEAAGNIPGLDSILRGEIMRKDALVNQLLNQNKEVIRHPCKSSPTQKQLWSHPVLHNFVCQWVTVGILVNS